MRFKNFLNKKKDLVKYLTFGFFTVLLLLLSALYFFETSRLSSRVSILNASESDLKTKLGRVEKEYQKLKNEDQYVINQKNKKEIENIQSTYKKAVLSYEKLLDLKSLSKNTTKQDELFAKSLDLLSEKNYATAEAILSDLNKQIDEEKKKIASSFVIPQNVQSSNSPPSSGYQRQMVDTDIGSFMVDIVTADLSSTRVVVDTASDSTCGNNCPVLPLGDYVSRSGAYAGVNGSYFCPAEYPSCAGRTNSFDTLLMNKNKVYFNSDNNVYSTVPAAIFYGTTARFVSKSLEWGRDTGVDGVIANQPLLVFGKQVMFSGDGDPKKGSRSNRSFIGGTGSKAYMGVVHNVTVAESAKVLQTLGIENAINLDSGGSTAFWFQGYKAGPGRAIPNAVLFVRK